MYHISFQGTYPYQFLRNLQVYSFFIRIEGSNLLSDKFVVGTKISYTQTLNLIQPTLFIFSEKYAGLVCLVFNFVGSHQHSHQHPVDYCFKKGMFHQPVDLCYLLLEFGRSQKSLLPQFCSFYFALSFPSGQNKQGIFYCILVFSLGLNLEKV